MRWNPNMYHKLKYPTYVIAAQLDSVNNQTYNKEGEQFCTRMFTS